MNTCIHNDEYLLEVGSRIKCIACGSGILGAPNAAEHRIIKSIIRLEKMKKGLGAGILKTIMHLANLAVMCQNGTISRRDMLLNSVSSIIDYVEGFNGECKSCVKVSDVIEVIKDIVTDLSSLNYTNKETGN